MSSSFPQYRRLQNKSYYKILSDTEMIEWQKLGSTYSRFEFKSVNFLDNLLIQDLLSGDNGRYERLTEEEFQALPFPKG